MSDSISILNELVSFDSSNRAELYACADWIIDFAAKHGIKCERVGDGLVLSNGKSGGRGLILSGHIDVVPAADQTWSTDPFAAAQKDGRIFGRGTTDMKGGVACMLNALAASRYDFPLYLVLTGDEEGGGRNVGLILDHIKPEGKNLSCIVGEPTELKICDRHKGNQCFDIIFTGIPCHAAKPQNGVSAIYMFSDFVPMYRNLVAGMPDITINVGKVSGGTASNIIPEKCECVIGHRFFNEKDADIINDGVRKIIEKILADYPGGRIAASMVCNYYPLARAEKSRMRDLLTSAGAGPVETFGAVSEASAFQRAGIDTVICGPGYLDMAHRPDEFTTVDMMDKYDALLADVLSDWR